MASVVHVDVKNLIRNCENGMIDLLLLQVNQ